MLSNGRTFLRAAAMCCVAFAPACSLLVSVDELSSPGTSTEGGPTVDGASTDGPSADGPGADGGTLPGDGGGPSDGPVADASWPPIGCGVAQNDPSLLAYFAFDDGAGGTLKDCSGRGHAGTIAGTPVWTTGKYGGALSFNGTDTCVDLGAGTDLRLGTFTLTAWANVTTYVPGGLGGHIVSKSTGNPNAIGWRFSTIASNEFETKLAVNGGSPFSVASPAGEPTATWVHVAFVLVPTQRADIYVGGARVANGVSPPAIYEEVAASMRLGCNAGTKDYYKGALDELRIYTRALSDAELAALAK